MSNEKNKPIEVQELTDWSCAAGGMNYVDGWMRFGRAFNSDTLGYVIAL